MEMTIHRGLAELKLLDARIQRAIRSGIFIAAKKNSADKVNGTHTVDEFNNQAKAAFQSINALIDRRNEIKTKIVKSNAETMVTIAGKQMTVATAIERKNSIAYEEELLRAMEHNYNNAVMKCNRENELTAMNKEEWLKSLGGKDKVTTEFMESMSKKYDEENGWKLVDPLHLGELIETIRKDIEDFKNEVDYVLSENNSITKIEVTD